ncbi:hypothetical protein SAMN05892883_0134 [Jatrophihabitans sp. GAS493]|uniref:DUF3027 domain-containing protein n=1 Tax=Jatrophihabitans sp. GAS493 TaxID=1907575 RepID=UPI000BB6C76C|nr:DUF3027 domain-containing protein [Jatrophihabitans sp. GAS493]SOD70434.1 hypothetical protein SAMN05892883_0134 [Jatrophihabitans sp. GAS493]
MDTTVELEQRPSNVVAKLDAACAAAADLARAAAVEASEQEVGEYLGADAVADRIVTHRFAASVPGYTGWHWSVTVARASRSKVITIDEVLLLPGTDALLAPAWVPWNERVRPGDLSPGDLIPADPNDPRLAPAYTLSDDPAVEAVAAELGVGRVHVMSREGRLDTAERWQLGETGPDTAMARHAPAHCGTCGFYLPLAGSLAAAFGACANSIANSDGRIVSVEHGCGAHSELVIEVASLSEPVGEIYEDEQFV